MITCPYCKSEDTFKRAMSSTLVAYFDPRDDRNTNTTQVVCRTCRKHFSHVKKAGREWLTDMEGNLLEDKGIAETEEAS